MPRVKLAPPRRPARRRHGVFWAWPPSQRALRLAAAIGGAVLIVGPTLYLWRVGVPDAAAGLAADLQARLYGATATAGLSVQEIYVEGRGETPAAQVLASIGIQRGAPLLAFSPAAAKGALEQLPWVREAAVERRLPDTIHVRLVERRPMALWQRHGRLALIDRDGAEIKGAEPARFGHLPVVVGDDAPAHAAALLALLATEPEMGRRVQAAIRVGARRWNLRLDAGEGTAVDVQLPEINAGAAWARLAELERANKVLNRNVSVIDLRLPDRLIMRVVRETPQPAPARGGRGNGRTT